MGCTSEVQFYLVGSRVVRKATLFGPRGVLSESLLVVG